MKTTKSEMKTDPLVKAYRADARYLTGLTVADAIALSKHGDPSIREAAATIRVMAERHENNEFSSGKDEQDIDTARFFASGEAIRKALDRIAFTLARAASEAR